MTEVATGGAVVLLHGWPGDRMDYRDVTPLLTDCTVVVPDLRGFGESDKHPAPPAEAYSAAAQARSVVGLIDELGLAPAVLAGYDVGSRVAQAVAQGFGIGCGRSSISPPLPGAGDRVLAPDGGAGVLVPGVPSAEPGRGDPRRTPGRRPRLPPPFLVPLVGAVVRPEPTVELDRLAERVWRARSVYRVDRVVPRRVGHRRAEPRGGTAGARRADRRAHHRALARARPAVSPAWSDRLGEFFADATLTPLPASATSSRSKRHRNSLLRSAPRSPAAKAPAV